MPDAHEETERWVAEITGTTVISSVPLLGGMSSVVTRHDLADGSRIVSRHITDTDWLQREPHLIGAEAAALELLAGSHVTAPRLVGIDASRGRLAMTHLEGHMLVTAAELDERVSQIATVARKVHDTALPERHGLPPWRPWASPLLEPPAWGNRSLWSAAIRAYEAGVIEQNAPSEPVLLHRDLHPLNLLWVDDAPAVVDWVNACVGHPHAELGHCRWNLSVLSGLDCADRFLTAYLGGSESYSTHWDLAPLMSFLPGPMAGSGWQAVGRTDLTPAVIIERTEAFLSHVLGG